MSNISTSALFPPRYRNYALGVLFLGYVVNFIDRSILAILLEPIKHDLSLSDSELGLLGGLAFALFYATLGIPIAALADRWSRVKVLAISMIIWSAMTALCGMASNFITLLIARIGVGVGEAGASPPSHSLISDYFPIESRATALSIYALGIPFGSMVGNFVGGWGAEELGWRTTFFLVGIPGILVAFLILATLKEPPRGLSEKREIKADSTAPPTMKDVFKFLWTKKSFRHIGFAAGLHAFVGYGAGTWNAPFLIRSHEMPITEVGSWLAIISGIGAIGTFAGGYLGDKISDRTGDRRWYLWVCGISTLIMVPFQLTAYLYDELWAVIPSLFVVSILGGMYLGPSFAMTQGLVTLRMRAVASAILLFMLNIIGMGLGPYFVGIASDLLAPNFAIHSLRYALCMAVLANLWAASHYFLGARTLREDLGDTEALLKQSA
ncbi:MAG TPA: MFS transporter [Gammaproteobacteria bacterium]|nr:MFS transporter [Gammaproteobacteria bacterium]HIK70383.1 MFS transporter [Pseudomonadales bacterium]